MKTLKILLLFTFSIGLIPTMPVSEIVITQAEAATRVVTGYGKTQTEAYADARSKIPSGYTETKSRFQKLGSRYHCYLTCTK